MSERSTLQADLDDLALKLGGDDAMLIWEARSGLEARDNALVQIRAMCNRWLLPVED